MKRAQLVCDAVSVCCPHCGGDQPNPRDGSLQWMAEDFQKLTYPPVKTCVECDAQMLITMDTKAQFESHSPFRKRGT